MPFVSEEQQLVDGFLDEFSAAYLTVDFGQGPLDSLIDTGFNGALVVGEEFFDPTNAVSAGIIHARVARHRRCRVCSNRNTELAFN